MPGLRLRLLTVLLPPVLAACTAGGAAEPAPAGSAVTGTGTGTGTVNGEVVVFAAASLTDAFEALAEDFEAANPQADVTLNFGSSNGLATAIVEAAPADVFASANSRQMDVVVAAELVRGEPRTLVENALEIAVEPGNPQGVTGLFDLSSPDLAVVLAAEEVPAGDAARQALAAADVDVNSASLEEDVRAVLTRVELGEADAGIVYRSDVVAAGDAVQGVPIPDEQNVAAAYPIASLSHAPNPEGSAAFVEYVLSAPAQSVLERFGFAPAAP